MADFSIIHVDPLTLADYRGKERVRVAQRWEGIHPCIFFKTMAHSRTARFLESMHSFKRSLGQN